MCFFRDLKSVSAMSKRMLPIGLAAVLFFLSGLSNAFAAGDEASIRVEHLRWNCAGYDGGRYCTIAFKLVNTTTARQIRKVHILGISSFDDQPAENKLPCGQMHFSILLAPGEVVTFQEIMPVASRPVRITVAIGAE
jgi:hypothetical protein